MSALGQKQTFCSAIGMSALPPIATSITFFGMSAKGHKWTLTRSLRTPAPADSRIPSILVDLANMVLSIKLKTKLGYEIELGFQKVDMTFLIVHYLLEKVACHIVSDGMTMSGRLLVKRARLHLGF